MRSSLRNSIAVGFLMAIGKGILPGGVDFSFAKTQPNGLVEPSLTITAHVYNYARVERAPLALAEKEATKIFQRAGLRIEWENVPISSLQSTNFADESPLSSTDIYLRIVLSSAVGALGHDREETLGFALASSKRRATSDAWVFSDRVEAAQGIAPWHAILGDAMAHEIGHLLLGSYPHSFSGLMRAEWRWEEYVSSAQGRLLFTPREAELMRAEVLARIRQQNTTQRVGSFLAK
ncbi:MAG TPA: hypothetical protein VG204_18190 [Terriglobia bacterium]|nr:hypothetical protein [Terriglobia bacterium]